MSKYLDENGLLFFWQQVKSKLATKEDLTSSSPTKSTMVDSDSIHIIDSESSNVTKRLTWTTFKSTLKSYFDAIYSPTGHAHSGTYEPVISTKNTAFNVNFETTATNIKMDGTQSLGSLSTVAKADHVHPSDTTRAALASPTFTGTPSGPTAAVNTNTTQLATTAFVLAQASSTTPAANGTAAVGTGTTFARADHVHASDTTKANLASPTFTGVPSAPTATAGTNTTQIATTAFVTTAVAGASGTGLTYQVVASLPGTGVDKVVYMIPGTGTGDNIKDEYMWINSAWEKIGSTSTDLSGYLKTTDMVAITNAEITTTLAS